MSVVRAGICGCGRIAERGYAPALERIGEMRAVAVCDPHPGRAGGLGERLGAAAYREPEQMLAAGGLDCLIACVPTPGHEAVARLAAEAGLPCLLEKPPAPDLAGAQRIASLSPAPWIGFNRRFQHGASLRARVSESGEIEMKLELGYRRASWRPHESDDDPLADLLCHLADLALWVAGSDPVAVRGGSLEPARAEAVLVTSRGPALLRCATDVRWRERVEVRAPRGGRPIRAGVGGLLHGAWTRVRPGHPLVDSLAAQLRELASRVRGEPPQRLAGAADGVRAMAVVDAARSSAARSGAEVPVPGPAGAQDARPPTVSAGRAGPEEAR